ncbi:MULTISPECIES: hypothetical protein [unclassified Curtobacterium]|uniref:hypothetical protein n=1 Tax=unclassified Curtobacterium TaxID=257496 RepID=UPI000DAA1018|nr:MULTISPECIES: hypothetical protein [unclassified Curtobacterium]PZE27970.1 hypothetical protein DEI86_05090 [Curtobacterium sp. MCBD17_028]PZE78268.1 hypothetical protein DEI82_00345 [Curtobacterium sp. MCBD17_019]PZF62430.1 hypothetical protein DEI92_02790 [Curtobacterium sp. MCBD17_034]PZF63707.1 hypothetical protein DEI81_06295 [Curtobacterium sp. MCBD17_013]PZM39864.1 hypothetical protein DEI90_03315 [Curtobacterium sp. MCBD17_031]
MIERGNTTHSPEVDEQMAHEAQSIVQGHGSSSHVEEFRQSEPVTDDTDAPETLAASGYDGEFVDDATHALPEDDADGIDTTVYTTETDQVSEGKVVDHGADDR